MSVNAEDESFDVQVLQAEGLVIADFYSDSCIPCRRMLPLLSEIEKEYADSIKLVKLNIISNGETAQKYKVTAVPTLIFFKSGNEKARLVGAVPKNRLIETINSVK